jgi:uncharacterized protein YukE
MKRSDPTAKPIQFYVSGDWYEALAMQAILCKTSLAGFVRSHLPAQSEINNRPLVPKNQQLSELIDGLAAIRLELKRIGNNVNQTAKVLNSHALHGGHLPTQLDLREEYAELEQQINRLNREIRAIGAQLTTKQ